MPQRRPQDWMLEPLLVRNVVLNPSCVLVRRKALARCRRIQRAPEMGGLGHVDPDREKCTRSASSRRASLGSGAINGACHLRTAMSTLRSIAPFSSATPMPLRAACGARILRRKARSLSTSTWPASSVITIAPLPRVPPCACSCSIPPPYVPKGRRTGRVRENVPVAAGWVVTAERTVTEGAPEALERAAAHGLGYAGARSRSNEASDSRRRCSWRACSRPTSSVWLRSHWQSCTTSTPRPISGSARHS